MKATRKVRCRHYICTRKQGSFWWVCYSCGKSLSPERMDELRASREHLSAELKKSEVSDEQ
jgi:hypothetical protein